MKNNQHNQDEYKTMAISYLSIRRIIGILGIAFPFILVIGSMVIGDCREIQSSISSYYHTEMRDVFVGVLFVFAMFLYAYKGYDNTDDIAGNLAGLFALGVAFFPTSVKDHLTYCIPEEIKKGIIGTIHLISAGVFFIVLSYISIFLFTKSRGTPTKRKIKRNKLYKTCGFIILGCILLIFTYLYLPENHLLKMPTLTPVFWLETIALWAFGTSWLTKGQVLLKDVDNK